LLSIEAPIVLPTKSIGQQFSDTVFFPTARGSCWFLLTPTLLLQHFIFRRVRHYKDSFFCYCDFVDVCVSHVHLLVSYQILTN
jgi:hypothetical protein